MITIISGTNRKKSNTLKVARAYESFIRSTGAECQLFSLEDLPRDIAFTYLADQQTTEVKTFVEKYFQKGERFIFVVPEYQGTFPGVFKVMIDAVDPKYLSRKKVLLAGVGNGRGGNLRGLDQLTGALHYLGMNIFPKHLPISRFREMLDANGELKDEMTLKNIHVQVEEFLRF